MPDTELRIDATGTHRAPRRAGTVSRILDSVINTGRVILNRRRGGGGIDDGKPESIAGQCRELVGHRGEASGLALANEILEAYKELSDEGRLHFIALLNRDFATDPARVIEAAERYRVRPDFNELGKLAKAIESPRHKLFRRLNMVPGGTSALVRLRSDLLARLPEHPELAPVDADLKQLLIAWFNRGFLELERIDWDSSARVLEKIIEYEAVHEINGWDDLRGRLKQDRRLFAFFHPAMPDDPVIFVEIALGKGSASAIEPLLNCDREKLDPLEADTATFYSISNCHPGLQGISFGNFLIKQVTENLKLELGKLKRFETLSPIPGLRPWLEQQLQNDSPAESIGGDLQTAAALIDVRPAATTPDSVTRDACVRLCAHYLMNERQDRLPLDAVARFHLSNGAYLDRINFAADASEAGSQRSLGMMVNYVYKLADIEKNHEAYFADGQIVASGPVRKLARL